jgi:hypothetical protein
MCNRYRAVVFSLFLGCSSGGAGPSPKADGGGGSPDLRADAITVAPLDSAVAPGGNLDAAAARPGDAATDRSAGNSADAPALPADSAPSTACGAAAVGAESRLDPRTCLVWQRAAAAAMTNKQAAKHCADLVLDGFDDWRVPAPEELATWPDLKADSNAYVTNPTYIPVGASVADGCTGNSHSCNLAEYNAGMPVCAWQGVGFTGPAVCVRGTALAGTTVMALSAESCEACKVHVAGAMADFRRADCLPYAN